MDVLFIHRQSYLKKLHTFWQVQNLKESDHYTPWLWSEKKDALQSDRWFFQTGVCNHPGKCGDFQPCSLAKRKCARNQTCFLSAGDEWRAESPFNHWIKNSKSPAENKIILCATFSRLDVHNNQDLYGLDMSIEVTRNLVKKGFRLVLFILFRRSTMVQNVSTRARHWSTVTNWMIISCWWMRNYHL